MNESEKQFSFTRAALSTSGRPKANRPVKFLSVILVASGFLAAASSSRAQAPWAATQPAGPVGPSSATLNGMATPRGQPTQAWFEWGPDGSYGQATGPVDVGSGGRVVRVSIPVGGLGLGEVCHYRLVAFNASGVAYGADHQFTTGTKISTFGDFSYGRTPLPGGLTNIVAIGCGHTHGLAVRNDGTVAAWMSYLTSNVGQTNVPAGLSNVLAVTGGWVHSVALRQDGTVVAWGRYFENGNDVGAAFVPAGVSNVIAIAGGDEHSVALEADGTVRVWGVNSYGQLNVPPNLTNVVAIAAGSTHTLALKADGTVVAWGTSVGGDMTPPTGLSNVIAIATEVWHNLALRADGTVVAWGGDYFGQASVPVWATGATAVSAGGAHSLAVAGTGTPLIALQPRPCSAHSGRTAIFSVGATGSQPLTWQWYHDGVLLPGATTPFLVLTNVQRPDAGSYTVVVTSPLGETNSQAATLTVEAEPFLASTTTVQTVLVGTPVTFTPVLYGERPMSYQWWLNGVELVDGPAVAGATASQLNLSRAALADTGNFSLVASNAVGIVTGLVAQLVVTPVGAWGSDTYGQTNSPASVTNAVAIAAGGNGSMALRADGSVVAWGASTYGQTNVPASVSNVVAIAAGYSHDLALRADGSVVVWGNNGSGQTNVPTMATNVVSIAGGYSHSLALAGSGAVVAWGDNSYGQTNVPPTATNVVAIAAGYYHNLALLADGTVVAWGSSTSGQTNVPAEATNVVAIAAGSSHSMALRGDGTVVVWGPADYGVTNVPDSATNVVAITAGYDDCVALRADGSVVVWGDDGAGQTNVPPWATNTVAVAAGDTHVVVLLSDQGWVAPFQPINTSVVVGGPVSFTAGTLGLGRASYQWQLNGLNLAGATNAALAIPFATWTNAGVYRVLVTDAFGSVTGAPIELTVQRSPLWFDTSPGGILVSNDGTHLRLLGASGVGPVVLLASSDLMTWEPILTNPPSIGQVEFIDPDGGTLAGRFYRAVEGAVAGPLQIELATPPTPAGNGALPLQVTGLTANGPVIIYASSNLVDWSAIFTNPPTIGPLQYLEGPGAVQPPRFYRASENRQP